MSTRPQQWSGYALNDLRQANASCIAGAKKGVAFLGGSREAGFSDALGYRKDMTCSDAGDFPPRSAVIAVTAIVVQGGLTSWLEQSSCLLQSAKAVH
jgi:hypothetical protein